MWLFLFVFGSTCLYVVVVVVKLDDGVINKSQLSRCPVTLTARNCGVVKRCRQLSLSEIVEV